MESLIRIVIIVLFVLITGNYGKNRARGRNESQRNESQRKTSQPTTSRKELDRRLSEGRARQRSDHSQVFGHSEKDDECINEARPAKTYSTTYVNDGRDPWEMKREKDPWEL